VGVRGGHVSALCHSCLEPTPALNHVSSMPPGNGQDARMAAASTCRRREVGQWLSILGSRRGTRQIGPPRAPRISLSVDVTNAFSHPLGTELQNKILPRFRAGSLATAGKLHDVDTQSRRRRRRGRRGRCVADSLKSDTVTPSSTTPRLMFVCMLRLWQQPCVSSQPAGRVVKVLYKH
jgi:hypothetical protein